MALYAAHRAAALPAASMRGYPLKASPCGKSCHTTGPALDHQWMMPILAGTMTMIASSTLPRRARLRHKNRECTRSHVSQHCMPAKNPLGIPNHVWEWRGQQVRYQVLEGGADKTGPCVLLVHGLFVNADHWRRNMPYLAEKGCRVFSIDLLGYGYSSRPAPCGKEAQALNGENGRDLGAPEFELGSATGELRRAAVPQRHPLGSAYNFFTWSEQLCDFVQEVVGASQVTLVCNSIGSISGMQAAVDRPDLFNGILIVNPNFRELHVAESPVFLQPLTSLVQAMLRETPVGKALFDALATTPTVKTILQEPYCDPKQVTDELVDVLLTPLLTKGSAEVVFDTLSYSAGPLPEQLLQDSRLSAPVWVCWGEQDPWTPAARVMALDRFKAVKRIVPLPGVGHCPHDEAPTVVNPLIMEFVQECV